MAIISAANSKSQSLKVRELGRWKLIAEFQQRLEVARASKGVRGSFADGRRKPSMESYLGLFLFGLLNPVERTMRGLQLYLMGMATLEELSAGIEREMARIEKRAKTKNP